MTPNTDFLTYKEGVYHRTSEAFKFQGNHVVKIVGWDRNPDGSLHWIIENSWGADWGEEGFGRIMGNGETHLDFYGIGMATYPYTMATYQAQQEAQRAAQQ